MVVSLFKSCNYFIVSWSGAFSVKNVAKKGLDRLSIMEEFFIFIYKLVGIINEVD